MTRILVTGFGSFPGAPVNPTEAIVHALERKYGRLLLLAGIELRTAILPVSYDDVESAITGLLKYHQPDVIVHLGLAGRRKVISIETRARNRLSIVHPDADGAMNHAMDIVTGGGAIAPARWPAARLVQAVKQSGCPAKPSIDAGDYLCNQALYLSLGHHNGLCGFIPKAPGTDSLGLPFVAGF